MRRIYFFFLLLLFCGVVYSQADRVYISKLDDIGLVCKTSFKKVRINGKVVSDNFVEVIYVRNDSIADGVGIKKGDLILSVNNQPVLSEFQVLDLINFLPKNVDVVLNILRNGERMDIVLFKKLGIEKGKKGKKISGKIPIEEGVNEKKKHLKKPEGKPIIFYIPGEKKSEKKILPQKKNGGKNLFLMNFYLGFDFIEVNSQLADVWKVERGTLLILKVYKDSPAQRSGLKAGDIILTVDGNRVKGVLSFSGYIFNNISKKKEFSFVVKRGRELLSLKIKPLIRNKKIPYHM